MKSGMLMDQMGLGMACGKMVGLKKILSTVSFKHFLKGSQIVKHFYFIKSVFLNKKKKEYAL